MSPRGRKTRGKTGYMISAVAEMYNIHPQTLRLYEREGLLVPSRTNGNTRLYGDEDLERLETILNLTRDLGVNLAGIEIILNMRDRMQKMQEEMQAFVEYVQKVILNRPPLDQERHPERLGAPRPALFDPNPHRTEVKGNGKPRPRILLPPERIIPPPHRRAWITMQFQDRTCLEKTAPNARERAGSQLRSTASGG